MFCLVCLEHLRKCSSLIIQVPKFIFGFFFYLERYFAKPGKERAISCPHPAQDISDCDIGDQLQREVKTNSFTLLSHTIYNIWYIKAQILGQYA